MKVTVTHHERIELDGNAIEEVFAAKLEQLCGGEHVYLDEKGRVMEWDPGYHGSGSTTELGNTTPVQIAALKLRDAMKKAAQARETEREAEEERRVDQRRKRRRKSA